MTGPQLAALLPALEDADFTNDFTYRLLNDVEDFLGTYVVTSDDEAAALALWALHTHAFGAAEMTPYLHISSVEPEAGKTTLLDLLSRVVARPWSTQRTTAAALVAQIDGRTPTVLLDESDSGFGGGDRAYTETLRNVLNAGFRRHGTYSKVEAGAVRNYNVFCPKALAGIGKLPDTVESRSIPIRLKPRLRSERVERFREREVERNAVPVRTELERWSARGAVGRLAGAEPQIPPELGDRAADVWEPLFAIADDAGGGWQARSRQAAVTLMSRRRQPTEGTLILKAIREAFEDAEDPDFMRSEDLVAALNANDGLPIREGMTTRKLAVRLDPYDIRADQLRRGPLRGQRGYWWRDFEDAWDRYLQ